jgi:hypothetical protein
MATLHKRTFYGVNGKTIYGKWYEVTGAAKVLCQLAITSSAAANCNWSGT